MIERRWGLKLLILLLLKKGWGGNLLGFGINLNKLVEVFVDLIINFVVGGLFVRKRLRFGGICIDSLFGLGIIFFKGSVNLIEGILVFG